MTEVVRAETVLPSLWHALADERRLRCPTCGGELVVGRDRLSCVVCGADYPVESGVPLLIRSDDVVSVSEQVMRVFNIPPSERAAVGEALAPLTRYRAVAQPEFANFFARFDPGENRGPPVPLAPAEVERAVADVDGLTAGFPDGIRQGPGEYRSVRLRNRSDRVLFTDDRFPLFLGYRLFAPDGVEIPVDGPRSAIPSPLRPGAEMTIPVLIRLPDGGGDRVVVRVHFVLELPRAPRVPQSASVDAGAKASGALAALRARLFPARVDRAPRDEDRVDLRWFGETPVAEMIVTRRPDMDGFPVTRNGAMGEFDVAEDVARAERFLADVLAERRRAGVARPRILEIGAGVHPIALRTCGEDATVVVSDISLVMQTLSLIMHRNHPAVASDRAAFASFDLLHPPFRDGTFDVVCICAAFHHLPLPATFLRRLAPLLAPGGRFVAVREPCLVDPAAPAYVMELSNGFNEQMFELSEWTAIFRDGGFVVDKAVIDFGCSLKLSLKRDEATDEEPSIDDPADAPSRR